MEFGAQLGEMRDLRFLKQEALCKRAETLSSWFFMGASLNSHD